MEVKYKIHELAKDLNLKSNTLIDLLKGYSDAVRKSQDCAWKMRVSAPLLRGRGSPLQRSFWAYATSRSLRTKWRSADERLINSYQRLSTG